MAMFFNRVAFSTATTGTGSVNVGAAISTAFLTPAEAGAENADTPIPYLIQDGADFEIGLGTYNTGDPATFDRDTVIVSKIGGTAGTSKIDLSGNAQVRFIASADEFSAFLTDDDVGSAAYADTGDFATAAQGGLADSALQPAAIGSTVQAYDADTAKLDVEDQTLTGGARVTSKSLGTQSTGTLTPDPGDRALQHYTNGGAHTLAPGSNPGSYLLDITNNGSAGAITTSGWTMVAGDSFTTTDGHKFRCHCSVGNGGSLLIVQALQ